MVVPVDSAPRTTTRRVSAARTGGSRKSQEPKEVGADGGAGDGEAGAVGVDGDGLRAETAAELVPVRLPVGLRDEDGVDTLGHCVPQADGAVVDGSDDEGVGVDLAHPGDAVGQGQALGRDAADEHGEAVAPLARGADEVVVVSVRRREAAENETVAVVLHAAPFLKSHSDYKWRRGPATSTRRHERGP